MSIPFYNNKLQNINTISATRTWFPKYYSINIIFRHTKVSPKHYFLLKTPETLIDETTLTKEFQDQYEQLFFRHLNEIILHNTITFELETATMEAIVVHVEQHLATLDLPSHTFSQLYHQFPSKNNITNHTIPPQLRQLLPPDTEPTKKESPSSRNTTTTKPTSSSATHTAGPTHQRKWKRGIQRHLATKKQQRQNSFLAKRPSPWPNHWNTQPVNIQAHTTRHTSTRQRTHICT